MPVEVNNKSPIIMLMIVRPSSWRAVVAASGRYCRCMESVYGRPILGRKGYVNTSQDGISAADPEECFPIQSVTGEGSAFGI